MSRLRITESLRAGLKRPLGELYSDDAGSAIERVKAFLESTRPTMVITVGDVVSRYLTLQGLRLDVRIVDNLEMRQRLEPFSYEDVKNDFRARNPPGTIESDAWMVVAEAIRRGEALVTIEGEEDLLTLPAILEAPPNSVVIYGQPKQGMVVVQVSEEKKREIGDLVKEMVSEDGEFQPFTKSV